MVSRLIKRGTSKVNVTTLKMCGNMGKYSNFGREEGPPLPPRRPLRLNLIRLPTNLRHQFAHSSIGNEFRNPEGCGFNQSHPGVNFGRTFLNSQKIIC